MGVEFLNRTKKTIRKHVDTKRAELATPGLFTVNPTNQPRRAIASISAGVNVANGEVLIVETKGGRVSLRRGNSVVGSFDNPAGDVISAIEKSGGAANGVVGRVHRLSKKAEVSLC